LEEFLSISQACDYVYVFDAHEWFCTRLYDGDQKMLRINEAREKWT
jgi:hypothetical protein